jgi:hypothetical protein
MNKKSCKELNCSVSLQLFLRFGKDAVKTRTAIDARFLKRKSLVFVGPEQRLRAAVDRAGAYTQHLGIAAPVGNLKLRVLHKRLPFVRIADMQRLGV